MEFCKAGDSEITVGLDRDDFEKGQGGGCGGGQESDKGVLTSDI